MKKFKIGDIVQVTETYDFNSYVKGKIATVVGHTSGGYTSLKFENHNSSLHTCGGLVEDGYGWNVDEDDLILMEKGDKKMTKFNVGDKVRVVGYVGNKKLEGQTGTVIGYKFSETVQVKLDKYDSSLHTCSGKVQDGYGWNCEEKALALVEGEKVEMTELKVGDKVKYVGSDTHDLMGKTGTIETIKGNTFGVRFDTMIPRSHTYGGFGWFVSKSNLQKISTGILLPSEVVKLIDKMYKSTTSTTKVMMFVTDEISYQSTLSETKKWLESDNNLELLAKAITTRNYKSEVEYVDGKTALKHLLDGGRVKLDTKHYMLEELTLKFKFINSFSIHNSSMKLDEFVQETKLELVK